MPRTKVDESAFARLFRDGISLHLELTEQGLRFLENQLSPEWQYNPNTNEQSGDTTLLTDHNVTALMVRQLQTTNGALDFIAFQPEVLKVGLTYHYVASINAILAAFELTYRLR